MPGVLSSPLVFALVATLQNPSPLPRDSVPADRHATAPAVRAARVQGDIEVDGRLDEASWAAAEPATRFTQTEPAEGMPASERTEVRVLIGADALYIGARLHDREPKRIKAALARKDDDVAADEFDVYLDTFHDHLSGVRFRVTPGGATLDGILGSSAQGSDEDLSWDPIWESGTQVDSLGWTAEIRIPLSQLRYNSTADGSWGIQFYRKILRKGEEDWFAFVPKSETGGVSRYGHLTGLGALRAQRQLELAPYLLAQGSYQPSVAGDPFQDGKEHHASAGLDLKYGLTSDLTLNATINPDFGQVEVDPAVVNLSVFETFFPEKRPFFVEGADVFRFGGIRASNSFGVPDIFFSRRIGREPQRSLSGEGVNYLDAPTETSILAAAKLSGRTQSGWSVGLLDAVTGNEEARYVDEFGVPVTTPVEPLTNYFVGRVRKDLRGGNSTVGIIATAVNRDQDSPELNSLLRGSAYSVGADFTNSWADRVWSLDGSVGFSTVHGTPEAIELTQRSSARYYQRPDATSFQLDPDPHLADRPRLSAGAAQEQRSPLAGRAGVSGDQPRDGDQRPGLPVGGVAARHLDRAGVQRAAARARLPPLGTVSLHQPPVELRRRPGLRFLWAHLLGAAAQLLGLPAAGRLHRGCVRRSSHPGRAAGSAAHVRGRAGDAQLRYPENHHAQREPDPGRGLRRMRLGPRPI